MTAFEAAESLMIMVSAFTGVAFDDRLLMATVPAVMVSESPDAFPMVVFPLTARSPERVVLPATSRVPATTVFPLAAATVNLAAPTSKLPFELSVPPTTVLPLAAA
ncbi:MAG: hypothetical protein ACK6EB_19640, partial [Planctomyces sp.]